MDRRNALKTLGAGLAGAAALRAVPFATAAPDPGVFTLPPLPFAFDALEPHLDAQTMELHHGKHHAAYVKNLNAALAAEPGHAKSGIEALLTNLDALPESIRTAVRNNGGGHFNHTLFWTTLTPGGSAAEGAFLKAVEQQFTSMDALYAALTKAALGVFGSGWAWLVTDPAGKLAIQSAPNQDAPLRAGIRPLFGIDVWEHAYYLKFQNRRADYLAAIRNVVHWQAVGLAYEARA
jgi:Fe-Mn family superoxide dismutase